MLTKTSSQLMDQFLEQLLVDADMNDVPGEVKKEMLDGLKERLENRLMLTIAINLSADDLATFNSMVDNERDEEKIDKFIDEKIPNYNELCGEAIVQFRKDYLGI